MGLNFSPVSPEKCNRANCNWSVTSGLHFSGPTFYLVGNEKCKAVLISVLINYVQLPSCLYVIGHSTIVNN